MDVITLSGSPFERGLIHGQALGARIRNFLADGHARIDRVRETPLSPTVINTLTGQHAAIIEATLPSIAEELKGLAAGAGISYREAVLLQTRMELIHYGQLDKAEGDCSTIAIHQGGLVITGQTIDLAGEMTDLGCVFRVLPEREGEPEILMYSFAGLLGYTGINSNGLSVNINMVLSGDWQPGVPPYLLVRHLLQQQSRKQCLDELQRIRRSSSRSFTIADKTGLINVEFTANTLRVQEGHCLLHTNHYLHPDLLEEDRIHFLFKNSSVKRLALLQRMLPEDPGSVTPEMLFSFLADHTLYPVGICAHNEGNIRRTDTVAAIVFQPAHFTLHARKGHTCEAATRVFRLGQTLSPVLNK
jgi:predicted choloylglycine hydrolase